MTRVLFVANWDWVLANFRLPLACRLRESGYQVSMCCPPGRYVSELEAAGFEWVPWELERHSMGLQGELASLRQLSRIMDAHAPDVIQTFTIKPVIYVSLVTWWRSWGRNRQGPRIIVNNLTGLGYLFSEALRARLARRLLWPTMAVCMRQRRAWTVLMNSGDRDRLRRLKLVSPRRTRVIRGTGVDTIRFSPARRANCGGAQVRVLFAGRLLHSKGVGEFVGAARELVHQRSDVEFLIAGAPDPSNPEAVNYESIQYWHDEGILTWLGHVDDLDRLLCSVDVVVLPSYYEGLPRVLLEGAASGCAIVGSDIDGCRELIKHGRNGLLAGAGEEKSVADAVKFLLDNPERRLAMAACARQHAVEQFDLAVINEQWIELYAELLGRAGLAER